MSNQITVTSRGAASPRILTTKSLNNTLFYNHILSLIEVEVIFYISLYDYDMSLKASIF